MAPTDLYVYGIIRSGQRLPAARCGLGTPPAALRLVPAGMIAAVVSAASDSLRARRRDLLAHQDLLLELSADGPVLPMRFGMVASGESTVRDELAAAEQAHVNALDRCEGRIELNVKALPVEDSLAAVVREDGTVRRLRDQLRQRPGYEASLRLGEAVAAALTARATAAATAVHAELLPLAVESQAGPDVTGCVRNTSFLVGRETEGGFRDTLDRLARLHRGSVELRLTGPLPCYSFVAAPTAVRAPAGRA